MISVNQRAAAIVAQMIRESEAIGVAIKKLKNGATVLDAGIDVPGSLEAGRLFSCACLGGLAQVGFSHKSYPGGNSEGDSSFWLPVVAVSVSAPHIACMASQYAGWAVKTDHFFAMGSGPARAMFADEEIYRKLHYRDEFDTAVLMLEGRQLPDEDLAVFVAEKCGVPPDHVCLLIAPTASLVGSIQIAARSSETGMHKLAELGFDVRKVKAASGVCPLAPVAADDLHAIGRTNDAILYGSEVYFAVDAEDDELAGLIDRVPSSSSKDYGTPFYELFQRYNGDFYQIDRMLFSPARVAINNLNSGRTFRSGEINPKLVKNSLLED
ncbi:MAG: methenyltetrahydromethanopterin cyclohydrolase [Acidobacteriota bacterium]